MFTEIVGLIETADQLLSRREAIQRYLGKVVDRIVKGERIVVVVGAGGVGKTTLGSFIDPKSQDAIFASSYAESITQETFHFGKSFFGKLITVPGQQTASRVVHWEEVRDLIAAGRVSGIIACVCGGYSTPRYETMDQDPAYEPTMTLDEYKESHRRATMELELELLREHIFPSIEASRRAPWMMTLVTKQDLWWQQRTQIRASYENGAYGEAIRSLETVATRNGYRHEYWSICLVQENLTLGDGTVVEQTAAGYTDTVRTTHQERFLRILDSLLR